MGIFCQIAFTEKPYEDIVAKRFCNRQKDDKKSTKYFSSLDIAPILISRLRIVNLIINML